MIFRIIDKQYKVDGFYDTRIKAEQNLLARGDMFTLDDIYDELRRITNADQALCEKLKALECAVEMDQAIPIVENINRVKSGDIVISDIYLPEEIIRKILDKAGLIVPVELIVTSAGKMSGRIWKQFSRQNQYVFNIGDNQQSDVENPRLAGFDSSITLLSQMNAVEKYLLDRYFYLAGYLREIRLRNPYTEEIKRLYWGYCSANFGMLILIVQLIDRLQKQNGFEYLGFCGRDSYYLWLLYKKYKEDMGEVPVSSDYLYYSRKLFYNSRADLAEYFAAKIDNRKALMVDLTGTGTHLHDMRKYIRARYSILVCYKYGINTRELYNGLPNAEDWIPFADNVGRADAESNFYFKQFGDNVLYEFFNRATHNTPISLETLNIGGKTVSNVTFSELDDTEYRDVLESCLREVLNSKIVWGGVGETSDDILADLDMLIELVNEMATPHIFRTTELINNEIDARLLYRRR